MIQLQLFLLAFTAVGFVVSLSVHVLGLQGRLSMQSPYVFEMHIGAMIALLVAIVIGQRKARVAGLGYWARHFNPSWQYWKASHAGNPKWMKIVSGSILLYALIYFFVAMRSIETAASGPGNREIGNAIRSFSSFWMFFFWESLAAQYSAIIRPDLLWKGAGPPKRVAKSRSSRKRI